MRTIILKCTHCGEEHKAVKPEHVERGETMCPFCFKMFDWEKPEPARSETDG